MNKDINSSERGGEDRRRSGKIVTDVSTGAPTTLVVPVTRFKFARRLGIRLNQSANGYV